MAQHKPVKAAKRLVAKQNNEQHGLLAFMQPMIAALSDRVCGEDPYLDYYAVSHEYLQSLINQVPYAVLCLDKDLKVTGVSKSALAWLKSHHYKGKRAFSPETILGKSFDDIFNPPPAALMSGIKNALKGKVWRTESIKHNTKKQDSDYWLRCEVFPWFDQNHEVTDVILFLEDITQQEELVLCNKKLQQSNELLESFNLIFSHDLIQPLRQVSNFLEIIQEHYEDDNLKNTSINDVFEALKKRFNHIQNLSEGIVLYCKNGDLTAESEQICLRSLIEELYESSLQSSNYKFNFNIPQNLNVHANRTCIMQLFQNLIANAIKHSPDENRIITLSACKENENFYRFHLHNHGICPSYIRKRNVFLPFESSASDGAGLGLMICKRIVSAYKGQIKLHSGKHKGTLVSFTLPACSSAIS